MNAKSKGFGLLAAVALTLTMFGGAMAENTDFEPVSAELTASDALCAFDLYSWGGGLGTWEYDGYSYVETSGNSTQYFEAWFYNYWVSCNVSVTFGGLSGPGGVIGTENFSANSWSAGPVDPAGHTVNNVYYGYDFEYTLNTIPWYLTQGTYNGTINATVTNAT